MRTRIALVHAAAAEFDRHGYAGTSMLQVCKAAGITTGALTFHFGSKGELADAVQDLGRSAVRAAVERVTARPAPALDLIVELTMRLAGLLEDDIAVRSAARLTRERPEGRLSLSASWLPTVSRLADHAHHAGQLRVGTSPAALAALVSYLLTGAEDRTRAALGGTGRPDAVQQVQQIWGIALPGICAERGV
ncbi:TetR family transcriptional regulator [Kitasatospora sp. NPDC059463]|uniref:TetR family transcriptional regulator n=1 Tax=unclassified Kitasatospora TaxID=2633591 RepID=UPI0036A265A5